FFCFYIVEYQQLLFSTPQSLRDSFSSHEEHPSFCCYIVEYHQLLFSTPQSLRDSSSSHEEHPSFFAAISLNISDVNTVVQEPLLLYMHSNAS
ncbi:MAG: hypothetical protein IKL29_00770, partial [Bacteroidaceae bacterium]|nr:hypothetical protein [Bacteroidaceae bacterium]